MQIILILITFLLGSLSFTTTVMAAQACQPLYGGGVTKEQFCPTPTPLPTTQTKYNQAMTKGGLPVNKPVTTANTPDTGPSLLGLLALAPIGLLGVLFRRQA